MSIGADCTIEFVRFDAYNGCLIHTADTAPLSRAKVNISSSIDAFVAFLSQDTRAIHGVKAGGVR